MKMIEELTYNQLRGLGSTLCQLVKLEGPDKLLMFNNFIMNKGDGDDILLLNRISVTGY